MSSTQTLTLTDQIEACYAERRNELTELFQRGLKEAREFFTSIGGQEISDAPIPFNRRRRPTQVRKPLIEPEKQPPTKAQLKDLWENRVPKGDLDQIAWKPWQLIQLRHVMALAKAAKARSALRPVLRAPDVAEFDDLVEVG